MTDSDQTKEVTFYRNHPAVIKAICRTDVTGAPRNILDIALDVHMIANGSFDTSRSNYYEDIEALKVIVDHWKEPLSKFDNACRQVLLEAIAEAEKNPGKGWI